MYWLVIIFEFFERGSYYGMMSILAVYLTDKLSFTENQAGNILGIIQPIVYFLPILSGAVADKLGYRRMLTIAFALLGVGYFLVSQASEYTTIFIALAIMAVGAGTFKPIISGTIAKVTDKTNSTLGFGIFYWSINFGAFLFPLLLVPFLKSISWNYVFIASALFTGLLIIPTIFFFKEPLKEEKENKENIFTTIISIIKKIGSVLIDWRFILFIFIYSFFWVLYFQMYGTVLWYVCVFVNATPLDNFINEITGLNFNFGVEHIVVINALTIILLQLIISKIVAKTSAIPTIIVGFAIATFGMFLLSFSSSIWMLICGLFVFSFGEMTAHPKYISYLGLIAPEDKKATYLGFGFLYGVFGSFIGSFLGSRLFSSLVSNPIIDFVKTTLIEKGQILTENISLSEAVRIGESFGINRAEMLINGNPSGLWLIFSGFGLFAIFCLVLYVKFIAKKSSRE